MTYTQKSVAGVVAFLALVGGCWLALHLHDKRVAENALLHQAIAADGARFDSVATVADRARARADSFAIGEAQWHARADSLHERVAQDSMQLAALSRRVRIVAPGMIEVARAAVAPAAAPVIDTVVVPPVVTNFMQLQAARIGELQASLAIADSGWAAADSLAASRQLENTALRAGVSALQDENVSLRRIKQPRLGFKSGVLFGVLASAGLVFLFSRID